MRTVHLAVLVLLAAFTAMGAYAAKAADKAGEADVDGHIWMKSDSDTKRAFLLGAGSAVVIEYSLRTRNNERPSRFVKGWVDVLERKTWGQVEKAVDTYYSSHPDQMDENVFRVIWKTMIEPNIQETRTRP